MKNKKTKVKKYDQTNKKNYKKKKNQNVIEI